MTTDLDTPLERWFAAAGLEVTEVDRCPAPACALCGAGRSEELAA